MTITCPACQKTFSPAQPFKNDVEVLDCPECGKSMGIVVGTIEFISNIFSRLKDMDKFVARISMLEQAIHAMAADIAQLKSGTVVFKLSMPGNPYPLTPMYPNTMPNTMSPPGTWVTTTGDPPMTDFTATMSCGTPPQDFDDLLHRLHDLASTKCKLKT